MPPYRFSGRSNSESLLRRNPGGGRSPRYSPYLASRRRFLQLSGAAFSGVLLSNCARNIGTTGSSSATDSATSSPSSGDNTLHVYTWSAYIDEDLLKGFEQNTGIKVIADVYDSNETMLARMQAGGGSQYSIVYPSDYMVELMIEEDMLLEIDQARVPGYADLLDQWRDPPYDPGNQYSVPYTWGTTGLVYNKELVKKPITDWSDLWERKSELSRRMTLLNDVREVMGMALKMLGFSNSTQDPKEIEAAYKKLQELKPAINAFTTDGWRDQMAVGDLAVAHAYSVDGIDMVLENPQLEYVVPSSGATVWTDTIAIPKTAPNVDAAYKWIEYSVEPQTAAKNLGRLKLPTPNQKTLTLLPKELVENPDLFPPEEVLAKCEVLANVGEAVDIYDRYWTQLTSA
ncbi:PotD/PotF family extracellular solute-binding protein [Leptolyngbya sp. O-77]|uniref:ABC transporter substrate-binding protein n=1 Tax=Leptolyngbya sp. O-77 TaxID=1080068 RepID=UPI00074D34EA|nr:spermidine/putrescine ABC transporter substrate-binding protein [Leptolyngbya sp. O-77]BAU43663.1 Spermidine/putrescine-binding periplasmic protein precursor [Leptolyngbya sp. O-77]